MILNDKNKLKHLLVERDYKGNQFQINVDATPSKKDSKQGNTHYL